ncbi:uncharacterized protein LOC121599304 [Anopheles merus]|uniref:DUF4806 domain-containing protein n=1 Tax=Anopheles merus TaxID=30066 RepID=A0A182V5M2_ANOME|nr:uncharacterized protein LOC121599304 [Anopheles merus]XP_041782950.1 uncharacterized protein LOC121599304 [Anopheles merus]
MPYVVVETVNTSGNKDLLAAPQSWLVNKTQAVGYLHWPGSSSRETLRALLANDRTLPRPEWERRVCKILYRNMPSLASAEKVIQTTHLRNKILARAASNSSNILSVTRGENIPVRSYSAAKVTPRPAQQRQQSANEPQLYGNVVPKEEDEEMEEEDPFGDVAPAAAHLPNEPAILDIEAKRLQHSSDEEEYDPFEDVSPLEDKSDLTVIAVEQLSDEAQRLFSSIGTEHDQEQEQEQQSAVEDKLNLQIMDMIRELKFMMISNQKEIRKIVSESMGKIHRTVNLLLHKKVDEDAEEGPRHLYERVDPEEFTFDPLTTVEQVEKFDEQLREDKYRKEIYGWVESNVGYESSSEHRMHTMLDLIFDRQLFAKFSWSGLNKKYPMQVFRNIVQLFEYIGSSSVQRIKREEVKQFLMKKLKQADSRKNKTFIRKSVPHQRRKFEEREWVQSRASKVKRRATETKPSSTPSGKMSGDEERAAARSVEEQPNVTEKQKDDEVQQQRKQSVSAPSLPGVGRIRVTKPAAQVKDDKLMNTNDGKKGELSQPKASTSQQLPPAAESVPEIHINPIKSLAQMKGFEITLNDEKRKLQVERWVDRTVGSIADISQRMKQLLERLIDKNFLLNFSWRNGGDKRSLAEFKNFVRLFEYASRTKLHNTVIYNHGIVSSFFIRTLDHVS